MREIELSYAKHSRRVPPIMSEGCLASDELTLVISGSICYTVEGKKYVISDSDAIYIPEGIKRKREATGECDYVSFNFRADKDINLPTHIEGACHSEVLSLILAIDRITENQHLRSEDKIARLVEVIISTLEDYERSERLSPLTKTILSYLWDHYNERVTLKDISELTYFSPIYCESVFKSEVGSSIIDYLIDIRISEAEKLIIENALSLYEVSVAVGFSDYNYFSRTFKKRKGYSPTTFKKMTRS